MDKNKFYEILEKNFGHKPNDKQQVVIKALSDFLTTEAPNSVFILKGYAGTGKTTIIKTLVKSLGQLKKKTVLIAPTGRAAKVVTSYAKSKASTIHHKIYFANSQKGGVVKFTLQKNNQKNTVYIVDEASMISNASSGDSRLFESGSIMEDLFSYIFSHHSNRLIFIGDVAQLPPVNSHNSPALNRDSVTLFTDGEVREVELDNVVRQATHSGILYNATIIREQLQHNRKLFRFNIGNFRDIQRLQDSYEIENAIVDSYEKYGKEDTCIIVYSNKTANLYNKQVRTKILEFDSEIVVGDYLMVVKNNYFWLPENSESGFIANGDIVRVEAIKSFKNLYGFRFAEVTIKLLDYPNQPPFDTVLLLDTIESVSPSLSYEDNNRLYTEVMEDYDNEPSKYKKFMKVKKNRYYNALQVKFSYAITCHKAQGGQWRSVIVQQSYLPEGVTQQYLRWLYTAVTRASEQLYLVGFKNDFFHD
ncbi:ATP-dependent exodeoxyribonuclease [Elysia marginata]|uniref:ATP-dependent exodeoxyribonuclease n=1 Tax=Elysia marginata TaxID=1093978 RepID=A0AAV4H141_9GAST|nr:ATP-dependent exodeoxyribonuclease [Elysia marginata]